MDDTNDSGFDLIKSSNTTDGSILIPDSDNNMLFDHDEEDTKLKNKPTKSNENKNVLENEPSYSNKDVLIQSTRSSGVAQPEINWKVEALRANFMPAVVKLDRKEINVNEIVDPTSENRLIHLAVLSSYLNVTRCLVENFECEINAKNAGGQTALHIACNSAYQDSYLLSYLVKNDLIQVNTSDKSGLSPPLYAVMNKFNVAFLALAHLKADLDHVDNLGNNGFYFTLTCDNKFAMKFFMTHMSAFNINQTFYKQQASLADILITTKNSSCTKHLVRYHHNDINLNSIVACRKSENSFPIYNKFNYDLLNTLYFYKTKNYPGFIKALLLKGVDSEGNKTREYTYKMYNLWFFIYDLMIQNTATWVKLSAFWAYSMLLCFTFYNLYFYNLFNDVSSNSNSDSGLFSLDTFFSIWQLISIFTLFISMFKFTFHKYKEGFFEENQYNLTNPQYTRENVCYQIYEAMERNPLDLFFEEEICEVCLIKKEKSTIHCNICKKCVKDFYFHSKFFNICFSKENILNYILLLFSFSTLHFSLAYLIYKIVDIQSDKPAGSNTIYSSNYLSTNLVFFILNASFVKLLSVFILFVASVLFFQKLLTLLACLGYKTTYYNMFRYHKRSVGVIQPRMNLYYNIPQMNLISLPSFIKNLFCAK